MRAREEHIRTRLGDDSVRVELPVPVTGYYAPEQQAEFVDLPFYWVQRVMGLNGNVQITHVADEQNSFLLGGRKRLRYTPTGWTW